MYFLKAKEEKLRDIFREELKNILRIKFYLTMQVRLNKSKDDQVETMEPFFPWTMSFRIQIRRHGSRHEREYEKHVYLLYGISTREK